MISETVSGSTSTVSLFDGRLTCRQYRQGYRFSQDSVLLAHSFQPSRDELILDLGTGCGIISLILAYRWPEISIVSLEVQAGLADLARRNVSENRLEDRIRIVEGDLRQIEGHFEEASFNRVVCNPPYRQLGAARASSDPEQAVARHEIMAGLGDIIKATSHVLQDGGRFDLIYPADRLADLLDGLERGGMSCLHLRRVYGYPGAKFRLVLVEAVKGEITGLEELLPLYIRSGRDGDYSPEAALYYEP